MERPTVAKPCATCGELTGRGYPSCTSCTQFVDRFWLADWSELPGSSGSARDLAERVVDAEVGEYAWTCVDWALRQLRCDGCRGELAAGAADCVGCATADSARWELPRDALSDNEHALRVAVVCLRSPHRFRDSVVSTWRLVLPFVLTGAALPDLSQVRTHVLAGRYDDLAAVDSAAGMTELPLLPWRRPLSV